MDGFQIFPLARQEAAPKKEQAFREDLAVRLICNNCPPGSEVCIVEEYSSGDLVCGNCGLVLGDRVVDTRSEWRTFANDEGGDDPSRVGGATNSLLGDSSSAFELGISFRDGRTGLAQTLQNAANRVSAKSGDRNLSAAFQEIQTICDSFSLPRTVSDTAKQLYKRQDEEKVCRGKPRDAVVAACVFIAMRTANVGRTLKEVQRLTQVDKRKLIESFKQLKAAFAPTAEADAAGDPSGIHVAASASHQVDRFSNYLGLEKWVATVATNVCNQILELGLLTGRSPMTVAGTAIYFASHLVNRPKSAQECADVAGIVESTLRNGYRICYPDRAKICAARELQRFFEDQRADISRLPVVHSDR